MGSNRIPIQTSTFERQGSKNTLQNAEKIAGDAALGTTIGAGIGGAAGGGDVLLTPGKPVVLETETRLTFQLTQPVTITEKLNQ